MVMATPAVKQKSSHGLGHGGSNANSGGDSSGYSSSSPPLSPPPSCPLPPQRPQLLRLRKFRSKSVPGVSLRRKLRYFLILPMFYLSGLLMCVGPFSAFFGNALQPGLVYRSHQIFQKLSADIRSDNSLSIELASLWRQKRKPKPQKRCTNVSTTEHNSNFIPSYGSPYQSSEPSGYLIVDANGGLNQQRSAICNAVAVAGLLNAILVIPRFDFHIVWRDTSEFGDIYDEDHFIASLKGHVQVVKELPEELMEIYDYNISNIPKVRVQAWAPVAFYFGEVYPLLLKRRVIRVAPFANRLSMNVPQHIQFLRCLANYEALRFSLPISTLANKLVSQMIQKSWHTGGKYVSIHLRFEEDMVAFSCCVYDGGNAEKIEMDFIRDKGWHGKFNRKDRIIRPGVNRQNGKCPLTPLEVGMMLRGMGFDNNTSIYLASGRIYQADRNLAPLREMFPLLYTKESLASHDELAPYRGYSSRLAALDYLVCLYSEVFVTTQGGNFPHFMMGHRRFLYDGHAKTIMPDKRKLALILQDTTISWEAFKDQMDMFLIESDRQGIMVPKPRKFTRKASIYTYPLPDCRCVKNPQNLTLLSTKALDTIDQLPSTM